MNYEQDHKPKINLEAVKSLDDKEEQKQEKRNMLDLEMQKANQN